jgi:isopentenyl-diphosphate delta-isomerase
VPERKSLVLVDETGRVLGTAAKLEAHEPPGRLHLAFSVFVFRDGETLMQRRAVTKYHFPGVWANACCSHPEPGEEVVASARARLFEELGLDCQLEQAGVFVYRAVDSASGMVEHELDHVLIGDLQPGSEPSPSPDEVSEVQWRDVDEAKRMCGPEIAPWFAEGLEIALSARARRK